MPKADLRDPGQLAVPHRHLRHGRRTSTTTTWSFATAAAYTGVMVAWGCAVWGTGYYYPPYVGYGGGYPIYYPHYPTYGYAPAYNPWTGAYGRGAVGLRSVRRRRRRRALQPADRHLCARRGGLRSVRRARRGAGLQPAHRRLRRDAAGLERLRQLGLDRRAARRSTGRSTSRVTNNVTGTRRASPRRARAAARPSAGPGRQHGGGRPDRQRRRLRRPRRQRLPQGQGDSWQKYDNGGWSSVQQPTRRSSSRRSPRPAPARPAQVPTRRRCIRSRATRRRGPRGPSAPTHPVAAGAVAAIARAAVAAAGEGSRGSASRQTPAGVTALVETGVGLTLLLSPPLVAGLLLGVSLDAPAALIARTTPTNDDWPVCCVDQRLVVRCLQDADSSIW